MRYFLTRYPDIFLTNLKGYESFSVVNGKRRINRRFTWLLAPRRWTHR